MPKITPIFNINITPILKTHVHWIWCIQPLNLPGFFHSTWKAYRRILSSRPGLGNLARPYLKQTNKQMNNK